MAKKKIDPLNKKQYGAVSAMLTVSDIPAAVSFYQKAFGFTKRGVMNGPDGKPIHAELILRGTTLMLGPETPPWANAPPRYWRLASESVYLRRKRGHKVVSKALNLEPGQGPVMDIHEVGAAPSWTRIDTHGW
jgi:uncharacterized glyoxalase superfamily protein PhnB